MMITVFESDGPGNNPDEPGNNQGRWSLPLKSKDVNLPNSRVLTLKRLNCLHRRFLKDNHFYEI